MTYEERLKWLKESHEQLLTKKNHPIEGNGVYERYANPVLTADHAPLEWRYDLHKETNPYLMERSIQVPSSSEANMSLWQELRELTGSLSSLWRRALMESIISVSAPVL